MTEFVTELESVTKSVTQLESVTEFVTEFRFVTESVTDLEIRDRFFQTVLAVIYILLGAGTLSHSQILGPFLRA